jgi:hypothetical protein
LVFNHLKVGIHLPQDVLDLLNVVLHI